MLPDGEKISDRLAGVLQISERVDDRDLHRGRQLDARLVGVGPDHRGVDPPLEILSRVVNSFALSEADVGLGEVDRMRPELVDADFEGHVRPQGLLLENHRDAFALEHPGEISRVFLDFARNIEDLEQVVARPVGNAKKVSFHARAFPSP